MKKHLLTALFAAFAIHCSAQTQRDNIMVGGSIANVQATFRSENSIVGLNLNPKIGYFIVDNFAIGVGANFGVTGGGGVTTINYGLLPFARYFFTSKQLKDANAEIKSKRTRFFGEVDFGFSGSNVINDNGADYSTNGVSFSAGPGMSYFITPNVGLETMLKLRGITGFGNSTLAFQPELSLGFQIYLPKKKANSIYDEEKKNMNK